MPASWTDDCGQRTDDGAPASRADTASRATDAKQVSASAGQRRIAPGMSAGQAAIVRRRRGRRRRKIKQDRNGTAGGISPDPRRRRGRRGRFRSAAKAPCGRATPDQTLAHRTGPRPALQWQSAAAARRDEGGRRPSPRSTGSLLITSVLRPTMSPAPCGRSIAQRFSGIPTRQHPAAPQRPNR